jgi:hypothetical protein
MSQSFVAASRGAFRFDSICRSTSRSGDLIFGAKIATVDERVFITVTILYATIERALRKREKR